MNNVSNNGTWAYHLGYLVLTTTVLWSRCYYTHFTDAETESKKLHFWPKIMQQVSGTARIPTYMSLQIIVLPTILWRPHFLTKDNKSHKLTKTPADSGNVFHICRFLNSFIHSPNMQMFCTVIHGEDSLLPSVLPGFFESILTCEETSHMSGGRQTLPVAPSRSPVVRGTRLDAGSVHHQISVGISCHWVWCNVRSMVPEERNQQTVKFQKNCRLRTVMCI